MEREAMKKVHVTEAIGLVLCHDMTVIIPGVKKGPAFRKGHIIREEDIETLLSMGKSHIYVWERKENQLHEDEAAVRLGDICMNEYMYGSEIKEGKINIHANINGLLKINTKKLEAINNLDDIMIATRHSCFPVKQGDKLAATRIIPLVINEDVIKEAEAIKEDEPLLTLLPYKPYKIGIVTTGSEVYHGRIKDAFGPVINNKAEEYNMEVIDQIIVDDNCEKIEEAINTLVEKGATFIICTGGMSVDPDDLTPTSIKNTGAEIVSYGAPILPGAMFLLAYKGDMPIIGVPGCAMYAKRTVLDLIFPRLLTGEKLTKEDLAKYGHGGLCLECDTCSFPSCSFGKGW
jgi:molybdenum cofactor synthesis domain-containing protein